jgi:hypothetical protein
MIEALRKMIGIPRNDLDVLQQQLHQALVDRANCAATREYYDAMERMLQTRVLRLQREVKERLASGVDK